MNKFQKIVEGAKNNKAAIAQKSLIVIGITAGLAVVLTEAKRQGDSIAEQLDDSTADDTSDLSTDTNPETD